MCYNKAYVEKLVYWRFGALDDRVGVFWLPAAYPKDINDCYRHCGGFYIFLERNQGKRREIDRRF